MLDCNPDPQPVGFLVALRVLAVVTLPINLFGVYCIAAKTPKHMKDARIIMLIYQISNTSLDFWFSTLLEPVLLFPLPFGKPHGLLQLVYELPLSIGILLSLLFCVNTFTSFLQVFHFRLNFVLPNDSRFKFSCRWKFCLTRLFYYIIFDGALIAAFFLWNGGDQRQQINWLLSTYSCAPSLLNNPDLLMVNWELAVHLFIVFSAETCFVLLSSIGAVVASFYYLAKLPTISEKTQRLQKQFQTSILLQAFVPIIMCFIPGFVYNILIIIGFGQLQVISNVILTVLSAHGCISTLLMLLYNVHYRKFVLRTLTLKHSSVNSESSTT